MWTASLVSSILVHLSFCIIINLILLLLLQAALMAAEKAAAAVTSREPLEDAFSCNNQNTAQPYHTSPLDTRAGP